MTLLSASNGKLVLGPKTKEMVKELAHIVEHDTAWPQEYAVTIFFRRRGIEDADKVPVVDLLNHVGGENIPVQFWLYLSAWEATAQASSDKEGSKTWLIQKLIALTTP